MEMIGPFAIGFAGGVYRVYMVPSFNRIAKFTNLKAARYFCRKRLAKRERALIGRD